MYLPEVKGLLEATQLMLSLAFFLGAYLLLLRFTWISYIQIQVSLVLLASSF